MYSLFRDLAIIILSAKFFGLVARKCKAPQVVGEIIAGLLIVLSKKLDRSKEACYNKLLSEQTRRTRQAMPHVVCTLGLITLRPLSPKGGATKWQSTKPC